MRSRTTGNPITEEITEKLDADIAMLRKVFNDRIVSAFAFFFLGVSFTNPSSVISGNCRKFQTL